MLLSEHGIIINDRAENANQRTGCPHIHLDGLVSKLDAHKFILRRLNFVQIELAFHQLALVNLGVLEIYHARIARVVDHDIRPMVLTSSPSPRTAFEVIEPTLTHARHIHVKAEHQELAAHCGGKRTRE